MPFVFSNFHSLKREFKDSKIITTTEFSNVIAGYFSMVQQRNATYVGMLKKSYLLKDELMQLGLGENQVIVIDDNFGGPILSRPADSPSRLLSHNGILRCPKPIHLVPASGI